MGSHFKSSHPDAKKELPKGLLFASVFLDLNVLYVTPSQTLPSGEGFFTAFGLPISLVKARNMPSILGYCALEPIFPLPKAYFWLWKGDSVL